MLILRTDPATSNRHEYQKKASSAEFVGEFWLRQVAKCVIDGHERRVEQQHFTASSDTSFTTRSPMSPWSSVAVSVGRARRGPEGPWADDDGGGAQGAPLAAPESEDERAIYLPQIVLKNQKNRTPDHGCGLVFWVRGAGSDNGKPFWGDCFRCDQTTPRRSARYRVGAIRFRSVPAWFR